MSCFSEWNDAELLTNNREYRSSLLCSIESLVSNPVGNTQAKETAANMIEAYFLTAQELNRRGIDINDSVSANRFDA